MKLSKRTIIALCAFFIIAITILGLLWYGGVFVTDRSAKVYLEGMTWKGETYSMAAGGYYTEGRTIAKSEDGSYDINEIKEDPLHRFVVVRSFLDQNLYVADSYKVPASGKITKACWNYDYIDDEEFIKAIAEIDAAETTMFDYETDAYFSVNDNQNLKPLYVAYEDCPIATVYKGYLGKVNGMWVITTDISTSSDNGDKPFTVSCYSIPDKYSDVLEKHFSE